MTGDGENSLIEDIIQNVEGYMHKNECYALYNLAKTIHKNCIVEIGSHKGRSSCCLGIAAKENNIKVYSVDVWEDYNKMPYATEWGIKTFVNENIYQIYLNNLEQYNLKEWVIPYKGISWKVGKQWNQPINLLLIDGDHSYEGIKLDFEAWDNYCSEGAFILFHDYNCFPGVTKYVNKLFKNNILKSIELVNSLYVTQKEMKNNVN